MTGPSPLLFGSLTAGKRGAPSTARPRSFGMYRRKKVYTMGRQAQMMPSHISINLRWSACQGVVVRSEDVHPYEISDHCP